MEELSQDILENFQIALQIIGDFCSQDGEKQELVSGLLIDVTLREAEYAKFYQDFDTAMSGFQKVIEYCSDKYKAGNERILCSAQFGIGYLQLEMGKRDEAKINLDGALKTQKEVILK